MMTSKQFWNWFLENSAQFLFLNKVEDEEKERLLDLIMNKLHEFCGELYFEIGGMPGKEQELIISAEGKKEYFAKVEELVSTSPVMEHWTIVAFKQPKSGFKTTYKQLNFEPNRLWFLPLTAKKSNLIGIRICHPDFDETRNTDFLTGAYFMLDTLIGEKATTLDIAHIEIDGMPGDPVKNGLIELEELEGYIKWRKNKIVANIS